MTDGEIRMTDEELPVPVAVAESTIDVCGVPIKVYQLSDGRRVVAAECLEKLFGMADDLNHLLDTMASNTTWKETV
jgi:hypothetical protein